MYNIRRQLNGGKFSLELLLRNADACFTSTIIHELLLTTLESSRFCLKMCNIVFFQAFLSFSIRGFESIDLVLLFYFRQIKSDKGLAGCEVAMLEARKVASSTQMSQQESTQKDQQTHNTPDRPETEETQCLGSLHKKKKSLWTS